MQQYLAHPKMTSKKVHCGVLLPNKNSQDEEWLEEFKVPTRQQAQELDYVFDMQAMVVDALQQVNDLVALEAKALDVVEKAFNVVNELQEGKNEGNRNGDVKPSFDSKGQQPLRDVEHFRERT